MDHRTFRLRKQKYVQIVPKTNIRGPSTMFVISLFFLNHPSASDPVLFQETGRHLMQGNSPHKKGEKRL